MEIGGKIECDNCGKDLENGSFDKCIKVFRLNPETEQPEILHLCATYERTKSGKLKAKGCGPSTITPARIKRAEERTAEEAPADADSAE